MLCDHRCGKEAKHGVAFQYPCRRLYRRCGTFILRASSTKLSCDPRIPFVNLRFFSTNVRPIGLHGQCNIVHLSTIFETTFARWAYSAMSRLSGSRSDFVIAICISALAPRLFALRFCKRLLRNSTVFYLILKMIPSIFYLVSLLAAGSNASPCKLSSRNSSLTESKAALHANAGLNLVSPSSSAGASNAGPSTGSSNSAGSSGTSGTSLTSGSITPASGSCPPGFLNTVFNTNAGQSPGFPSTTWDSLTKHGIDNWSMLRLAAPKRRLHAY